MANTTKKFKQRLFRRLHDPEGVLYQLAHARRPNTSEEYDGKKLKATFDRMIDGHIQRASGIEGLVRTRAPRRRD